MLFAGGLLSPATIGVESAAAAHRAYGDARVLVPAPHVPPFPEGIAVHGNRVYVAGPATFATTGKGPSQVRAFDVVTIATPSASGVSVLGPSGSELARLGNPPLSPIAPYDSPANIAFNRKGSILLTNHALATGALLPQQFTVVDVFVEDRASPLVEPILP